MAGQQAPNFPVSATPELGLQVHMSLYWILMGSNVSPHAYVTSTLMN